MAVATIQAERGVDRIHEIEHVASLFNVGLWKRIDRLLCVCGSFSLWRVTWMPSLISNPHANYRILFQQSSSNSPLLTVTQPGLLSLLAVGLTRRRVPIFPIKLNNWNLIYSRETRQEFSLTAIIHTSAITCCVPFFRFMKGFNLPELIMTRQFHLLLRKIQYFNWKSFSLLQKSYT